MNESKQDQLDHEVEALLRDLTPEDLDLSDPPAGLWDRIESATNDDPSPEVSDRAVGGLGDAAPVVRLDDRRRSRTAVFLGAAAAVMLLVAGAVVVSTRSDSSTSVVATAELTYDETFDELGVSAVAAAELVENDDGSAEVRIVGASLPSPSDESADLELWLIEPDADGNVADLVSLGLVDPAEPGVYQVPDGYDPGTFFVVDISVEPRDGQPAHSGRSILRGALVQV